MERNRCGSHDEVPRMRNFSLLYGPVRTWLPILAFVALAAVVFLEMSSSASDRGCDGPGCVEPLTDGPELLRNDRGLDADADSRGVDDEVDPWSRWAERSDRSEPEEVPFVPLRPSPRPMTDAGRELVRDASSG